MSGDGYPGAHRELRELLGLEALGLLDGDDRLRLRAHLDGCADCRAELAELAPLAGDLRLVDPARLSTDAAPPRALGARVRAAVREESVLRTARERRAARRGRARAVLVPVAAAAVAAVLAAGATWWTTRPDPVPPVAVERLPFDVLTPGVQAVGQALVVPHTWGVEVSFAASGFDAGRTYRTFVVTADGATRPAGEFLGVGAGELECDLQAAVLREDVTAFEVVDDAGARVLLLPMA